MPSASLHEKCENFNAIFVPSCSTEYFCTLPTVQGISKYKVMERVWRDREYLSSDFYLAKHICFVISVQYFVQLGPFRACKVFCKEKSNRFFCQKSHLFANFSNKINSTEKFFWRKILLSFVQFQLWSFFVENLKSRKVIKYLRKVKNLIFLWNIF